jgi:hypothetical protein
MSIKLTALTHMILTLNAAIDTDRHGNIYIEEIENHIEQGDIIPWVQLRTGGDLDLRLFDGAAIAEVTAALERIRSAYAGVEYRRWGVKRSGLCLLLAWTVQLVQLREWEDPR